MMLQKEIWATDGHLMSLTKMMVGEAKRSMHGCQMA